MPHYASCGAASSEKYSIAFKRSGSNIEWISAEKWSDEINMKALTFMKIDQLTHYNCYLQALMKDQSVVSLFQYE